MNMSLSHAERESCVVYLLKQEYIRIIKEEQLVRKVVAHARNAGLGLLFRTLLPPEVVSTHIGKFLSWKISVSEDTIDKSQRLGKKHNMWNDRRLFEAMPLKEQQRRAEISSGYNLLFASFQ